MKVKPKPNQVVVALTPVIFAPLAGAISVWAAKNAGVDIDQSSLQAVFIAGATIALAKAGLWLRGWQEYEKRQSLTESGAPAAGGAGAAPAPGASRAPVEEPAGTVEEAARVDDAAAVGDADPVDDDLDLPADDEGPDGLPEDDDDLDGFLEDDLADDDLAEDNEPVPAGIAG